MNGHRGFALLAVLWVTVALAALTASVAAGARNGLDGSRARVQLVRGRWAAEACLAAAHAAIENSSTASDTIVLANGARCTIESTDPSARLHADSAPPPILARLDSILSASNRLSIPLSPRFSVFLTRDGDGRVNLNTAPYEVLASLPGMGAESVRYLLERRRWKRPIGNLYELLGALTPGARERLELHLPELLPLVTFRSDWTVLTARGWMPGEPRAAVIEEVVVAAGSRAATVQRRLW